MKNSEINRRINDLKRELDRCKEMLMNEFFNILDDIFSEHKEFLNVENYVYEWIKSKKDKPQEIYYQIKMLSQSDYDTVKLYVSTSTVYVVPRKILKLINERF